MSCKESSGDVLHNSCLNSFRNSRMEKKKCLLPSSNAATKSSSATEVGQLKRSSIFGFFDDVFVRDLGMTLIGLSILAMICPQICFRFITTDGLESFISTLRSCTKAGGGQLTLRADRLSARRAILA